MLHPRRLVRAGARRGILSESQASQFSRRTSQRAPIGKLDIMKKPYPHFVFRRLWSGASAFALPRVTVYLAAAATLANLLIK